MNILQHVQFQIVKAPTLPCINPEWNIDAVAEFWIILIAAVAIPFSALLYYLIKSLHTHVQNFSESYKKAKRFIYARNCIRFTALFLFMLYPIILTKILQILPVSCYSFCTVKQNGTCVHSLTFLRTDYSIPCPTLANHRTTLTTAYICLTIPLGLPIILFILLHFYSPRKAAKLHRPYIPYNLQESDEEGSYCPYQFSLLSCSVDDADHVSGKPVVQLMKSALKFTYENYHVRCWYWEVIEMVRKLIMTTGIVLFLRETKVGLSCMIIVSMFFTILHALMKPMKHNFENAA